MAKENEKDSEDNANEFYRTTRRFDLWNKIVDGIVKLGIVGLAYLSIKELAGKTTIADFVFKYITSEESSFDALPWILTIVFCIWAVIENGLRKRKTKYFEKHIKKLEESIDPNRTSSGLLPTGETNPKDE